MGLLVLFPPQRIRQYRVGLADPLEDALDARAKAAQVFLEIAVRVIAARGLVVGLLHLGARSTSRKPEHLEVIQATQYAIEAQDFRLPIGVELNVFRARRVGRVRPDRMGHSRRPHLWSVREQARCMARDQLAIRPPSRPTATEWVRAQNVSIGSVSVNALILNRSKMIVGSRADQRQTMGAGPSTTGSTSSPYARRKRVM